MSLPPAVSSPNSPGWSRHIERLRAATRGRFTILRELGRGGFAAVFLAQQHQPNRRVAIKLLLPAHLDSQWALEHFRGESQKIAEWRHQSVVTIYEVHEVDDLFFFVMSYVEGGSLHDLIARLGPLSIPLARSVLAQMGGALQYAHRQGVTHRDIKPQNVLIDVDGAAVVTDFGISKEAGGTSLTVTGMLFGSPPYMSPEQCSGGTATAASDQYSLGIVAYEMLTGHPPFTGPPTSVLISHIQDDIPLLRTVRPDCPPEFEAAVARMLSKNPADRFPSVAEAVAALGARELPDTDPHRERFARAARDHAAQVTSHVVDIQTIPPRLEVGERVPIGATARTLTGAPLTDAGVEWTIDDQGVAHLDQSKGILTAVSPGSATLMVRGAGTEQMIRVDVVPAAVATIQVAAPANSLKIGERTQLHATARSKTGAPLPRKMTWVSENPTLAVVSPDGVVEALQPGRTRIRAIADEISSEFWLEVSPLGRAAVVTPVESPVEAPVRPQPDAASAPIVAAPAAPAAPVPAARPSQPARAPQPVPVRASGSGRRNLTVGAAGLLLVAAVGVYALRGNGDGGPDAATLNAPTPGQDASGGAAGSRSVTDAGGAPPTAAANPPAAEPTPATANVPPAVPQQTTPAPAESRPTRLYTLTSPLSVLTVGDSVALRLTANDGAPVRGVTWSSSATDRATVSANGLVRARSAGNATITARVDGVAHSTTIAVRAPVVAEAPPPAPRTFSLTAPASEVTVGDSIALRLTANDGDPVGAVRWTSSAPDRATVSGSGVVRAVGEGPVTITAQIGAQSYTSQLTVRPAAPPARPVTPPAGPPAEDPAVVAQRDVRQLVSDYAAALSARNLNEVVRLYPTMPADVRSGWRGLFTSAPDLQVAYNVVQMNLAGATPTARVSGQHRFTNPSNRRLCQLPVTFDFRLVQSGGTWRIAGVDQVGTAPTC